NVDAAIIALRGMSVADLRKRYAEVFGEPTRSFNKDFLVKRIAWRIQAIREGGLSERARRRAMELANDADLRLRPPPTPQAPSEPRQVRTTPFRVEADQRLPMPGTLLKREYKGQMIHVRVLSRGFEFGGEVYRSLTAIAQKITGSHWNGYLFFGLKKPSKEA